MIEISHHQARRFIRQKVDDRLSGLQWPTLQAHLENCTECRAYQRGLERVEIHLRRELRANLERVHGPGEGVASAVIERRRQRAALQRRLYYAGGVLAAILVIFLVARGIISAQQATPVSPTGSVALEGRPLPTVTSFPTPLPGEFRGVVAFESRHEGNGEIYLLNPGAEPFNLTANPAEDSSPAWSPDGEWVAFLSDREGGKSEVYVMHISGAALVKLTNEPGIGWQGPLSWSADGRWIALAGARNAQGGQRYVYLTPLDGSGPRTLAGTRDAYSPEFAPGGERLAFLVSNGNRGGVFIADLAEDDAETLSSTWEANYLATEPALGSGLDWSPDGASLAYISYQPLISSFGERVQRDGVLGGGPPSGSSPNESGALVMAVNRLGVPNYRYYSLLPMRVAESRWSGAFRAVSWTPGGAVLFLEDLDDARANDRPGTSPDGCWTLQARIPSDSREPARQYPAGNLCIEGGIDRGSWTSDGRWLVVTARRPGELTRSLYALRMPGRAYGWSGEDSGPADSPPGTVIHLMGLSLAEDAATPTPGPSAVDLIGADLPRVRPRLRPGAVPLAILPQAVKASSTAQAFAADAPLLSDMSGARGRVLYSYQNNTTGTIVVVNPNGSGGRVLTSSPGRNVCPRWSPDGGEVAFVSDRLSQNQGSGEAHPRPVRISDDLFIVPENGEAVASLHGSSASNGAVLVSRPELFSGTGDATVNYGCPVWSPDGQYVAAFAELGSYDGSISYFVVVLAVDGESDSWAEAIERPTGGPTWTPDSQRLVLAHQQEEDLRPLVIALDLPGQMARDVPETKVPPPYPNANPVPSDGLETPQVVVTESPGHLRRTELHPPSQWRGATGLTASPDGWQVVLLSQAMLRDAGVMTMVRRIGLLDDQERVPIPGGRDAADPPAGRRVMAWLPDDALGMILRGSPNDLYKATIQRYDLTEHHLETLAQVEDVLYEVIWSPDGRWLLFSSESGLWGLDANAARQGHAAPVWISPVPVYDMDWK